MPFKLGHTHEKDEKITNPPSISRDLKTERTAAKGSTPSNGRRLGIDSTDPNRQIQFLKIESLDFDKSGQQTLATRMLYQEKTGDLGPIQRTVWLTQGQL